ncbi:hypothetical protein DVH05_003760 [Phytophthora capsici]|nr:hypothetical protein DVH05_003760 [Phytophthora capsici]
MDYVDSLAGQNYTEVTQKKYRILKSGVKAKQDGSSVVRGYNKAKRAPEESRKPTKSCSPSGAITEGSTEATPKTNRKPTVPQATQPGSEEDDREQESESFLERFPIYWASWEKFNEAFTDFQEATFQHFSSRTSTSVISRSAQITAAQERVTEKRTSGKKTTLHQRTRAATGGTLLPESWVTYSKTYWCTHGMPFSSKGSGKRSHTKVRATGCSARLNVRVKMQPSRSGFHLVVKSSGAHNPP